MLNLNQKYKNLFKKTIFFLPINLILRNYSESSSGMCIITTKDALSAKYFIKNKYSGIIEKDTKNAFRKLIRMSNERKKIVMFKKNIYLQTKKNYNFNEIKKKISNKLLDKLSCMKILFKLQNQFFKIASIIKDE